LSNSNLKSGGEMNNNNAIRTEFMEIVQEIYQLSGRLNSMYPGRRFTPDGHMVGSIGEVIAAERYGLELLPPSSKTHDATKDGLQVQIKATQGNRIAISSEPEHLLVLRIERDGTSETVYNGPGGPAWKQVSHKPRPKNGQYQVGLARLRGLMVNVPEQRQLREVKS
jgi:hypothetical protein